MAKENKAVAATEKKIKYSDKSEGQPLLVPIFERIKEMLKPYIKGTIEAHGEEGGIYNLVSRKKTTIAGREKDELFFASIIIQKGFVGFYFFPVYTDPDLAKQLPPELVKCLKGKSCFHIKKDEPVMYEQIKEALAAGYKLYNERGWV